MTSLVYCHIPGEIEKYVINIASYVRSAPLYLAVLRIFLHNSVVLLLCALLGRAYLGFVLSLTSLLARELARGYPFQVVLGAHTLLEIYSYSLATTRRKRDLVKAVLYLMVAATVEAIAIRF